jgi:hypothetical protein
MQTGHRHTIARINSSNDARRRYRATTKGERVRIEPEATPAQSYSLVMDQFTSNCLQASLRKPFWAPSPSKKGRASLNKTTTKPRKLTKPASRQPHPPAFETRTNLNCSHHAYAVPTQIIQDDSNSTSRPSSAIRYKRHTRLCIHAD